MKVYATRYNLVYHLNNIINRQNPPVVNSTHLQKLIFNKEYYLSDEKIDDYKYIVEFLSDPAAFIQKHGKVWRDTNTYYIEANPKYHKTPRCERLNQEFQNIEIPKRFRNLPRVVELIRAAPRTILEPDHAEKVTISLCERINSQIELDPPITLDEFSHLRSRAGITDEIENDVKDLIDRVETLHIELVNYLSERKYLMHFKSTEFYIRNYSSFEDAFHVKGFRSNFLLNKILGELRYFRRAYYYPITRRFKYYAIALIKPDVNFDIEVLDQLGFKECHTCFNKR